MYQQEDESIHTKWDLYMITLSTRTLSNVAHICTFALTKDKKDISSAFPEFFPFKYSHYLLSISFLLL